MKLIRPIISGVTFAAMLAALPMAAQAERTAPAHINIRQVQSRMAPNNDAFHSQRSQLVDAFNARLDAALSRSVEDDVEEYTPGSTLGPTRLFYDLDGPDGNLWYSTVELKCKEIEHPYYTEYVLTEYVVEVYDSSFKLVGTIHDKMRYQADEVRVPGPEAGFSLLPVVTKNFYNNDDLYEVVVALAVNTATPGRNHYRSYIYSLGGEKETVSVERGGETVEIEVDKPQSQFNGFVSDVLNASTPTEEIIYMTYMSEGGSGYIPDWDKLYAEDPEEGQKYWESISSGGFRFNTYAKADADGKLKEVFKNSVSYQCAQGDQESSPTMITFERDGKAYILFPHYKDTFFNPYYSPYQDMTMREGNSLVIDLYTLTTDGSQLVSTTEVPMEKGKGSSVLATYYSVGDLRYTSDIDFDAEGNPVYTLTTCNYTTLSDETSDFCYYRIDSKGDRLATIFEGAESSMGLTNAPGHNPQAVFVKYEEGVGYVYNMIDLVTGVDENSVKIPYLLDTGGDDPEVLSFNLDRVPLGDTYKYAFEMRAPLVDEYDNNYMRVAWFNADGSFDRIDYINMGQAVNYAQCYISGFVLNPNLVKEDDAHEYLILIKRGLSGLSSQSQEEFIIAQPTDEDLNGGRTLMHLVPCEKGTLQNIGVYPGVTDNDSRLGIFWGKNEKYLCEFYDLPLKVNSIEEITSDKGMGVITFDGRTILAEGHAIKVYNLRGVLVGEGISRVDVGNLTPGIYVTSAGDSVGKFIIR